MSLPYATAHDVLVSLGYIPSEASYATQFESILPWVDIAGSQIDSICGRVFYPEIKTKYFNYSSLYKIHLIEELISVSEIITYNGNKNLDLTKIHLMGVDSTFNPPFTRILIDPFTSNAGESFAFSKTPFKNTSVKGVWGYDPKYGESWAFTTEVLSASMVIEPISTIQVLDVDGLDLRGRPYRLQVGMMIQIDTEWMFISALDRVLNILTVVRGYHGSDIATHLVGSLVYKYVVNYTVARAAARLASWYIKQTEGFSDNEFVSIDSRRNVITLPGTLPRDFLHTIAPFIREAYYAG